MNVTDNIYMRFLTIGVFFWWEVRSLHGQGVIIFLCFFAVKTSGAIPALFLTLDDLICFSGTIPKRVAYSAQPLCWSG